MVSENGEGREEGEGDGGSAGKGVKGDGGIAGEGVKGDGGIAGEGVKGAGGKGEGVPSDSTHGSKVTETGDEASSKDSVSKFIEKGASQYKLVFMEELSSESSLAGSMSPQNLESSGSFLPVPVLKVNSSEDHLEADENRSTVSSSTLIAGSNFSGDTADTLKEEEGVGEGGVRRGKEEVDGEGEVVKSKLDGERREEGNVSPTSSNSVTPPPKSKVHPLSRHTSDSDAIETPPFSPLEYHSGDDDMGGRTPTFPLMTPSPLPPGTDSPLGDQPAMSILFSGVFYLGSSTVDAPISETEANRKMNILHEQALTSHPMPVILSVPVTNDGSVLLKDPKTDQPLTTFLVKMILFCARGNDESLHDCFCLNVRHKRSGTYHCHVFQCEIMEAVS